MSTTEVFREKNQKLWTDTVVELLGDILTGVYTAKALANKYNVVNSTVYNIKKYGLHRLLNKNWIKITRINDAELNAIIDVI